MINVPGGQKYLSNLAAGDWGRHADNVIEQYLLSDNMSSGWGIRTLSSRHPAFDPVGYHTGSIWPHDCSIIAHGMKLLGFDREAVLVLDQLGRAATHLTEGRLPELFCGFSRADVPVPVEYPVACRPQAWAAASSLLAVRTFGGIVADASRRSLHITRPTLPAWLQCLDVLGMSGGRCPRRSFLPPPRRSDELPGPVEDGRSERAGALLAFFRERVRKNGIRALPGADLLDQDTALSKRSPIQRMVPQKTRIPTTMAPITKLGSGPVGCWFPSGLRARG
jgi:hypothetical protein